MTIRVTTSAHISPKGDLLVQTSKTIYTRYILLHKKTLGLEILNPHPALSPAGCGSLGNSHLILEPEFQHL
jgi:hypothetical protein